MEDRAEGNGRSKLVELLGDRRKDFIDEKVISPIASIYATSVVNSKKPLVAFAIIPNEGAVKISARGSRFLIEQGLNLGDILHVAAESFSGRGGGHDIAAGAQVPSEHIESFLELVDKLVQKQIAGES